MKSTRRSWLTSTGAWLLSGLHFLTRQRLPDQEVAELQKSVVVPPQQEPQSWAADTVWLFNSELGMIGKKMLITERPQKDVCGFSVPCGKEIAFSSVIGPTALIDRMLNCNDDSLIVRIRSENGPCQFATTAQYVLRGFRPYWCIDVAGIAGGLSVVFGLAGTYDAIQQVPIQPTPWESRHGLIVPGK